MTTTDTKAPPPLIEHKGVRQFIKFVIVGATSFIVNVTLVNLLNLKMHVSLVAALTVAFLISVVWSFYWNRRWTFKEARGRSADAQGVRFLLVNVVGWFLNTSIVVCVVALKTGGVTSMHAFTHLVLIIILNRGRRHFAPLLLNAAIFIAASVVVFWNFFANRFWTFRH
jgi:putative flippase GtrA